MPKVRAKGKAALQPSTDRGALATWVEDHLHVKIPQTSVCPGHRAPLDYLWSAFHEPARDLVVWAPRGGGKTFLGAVATLLDLLHKPKCSVRILGGSLEQSLRMWEHLEPMLMEVAGKRLVSRCRSRRIEMRGGGSAAVLTQSQRAVRGLHVQKLRCDEVEGFDRKVWEAAQLVPRSAEGAAGVIEAISTFHNRGGLMEQIIERAGREKIAVIKWCLLEVLERCPVGRECAACPLLDDCNGAAREKCEGWVSIDDAIAQKRRVSAETWESEMLCRRPVTQKSVFGRYNEDVHVTEAVPARPAAMWLGIDFGYSNPFVCLWIAEDEQGRVFVVDEYVQEGRAMWEHIKEIAARRWGKVRHVACDPSGAGANDQTAASNVLLLRQNGYEVHYRQSRIVDGVEMVRAALCPATGPVKLFVHPRCKRVRAALLAYRYPDGGGEIPRKDGVHDHPMDALRYWFVNRNAGGAVRGRMY